MNLKLAPKGEEAEEALEPAGVGEAPSGDAECARGSQRLRRGDVQLPQHRFAHRMCNVLLLSVIFVCLHVCIHSHNTMLLNAVTPGLGPPHLFCGWSGACAHACLLSLLCSVPPFWWQYLMHSLRKDTWLT